jgi:hypothetical protein
MPLDERAACDVGYWRGAVLLPDSPEQSRVVLPDVVALLMERRQWIGPKGVNDVRQARPLPRRKVDGGDLGRKSPIQRMRGSIRFRPDLFFNENAGSDTSG